VPAMPSNSTYTPGKSLLLVWLLAVFGARGSGLSLNRQEIDAALRRGASRMRA